MERKLFEKILLGLEGGRLTLVENSRVSVYGKEACDGLNAMIEIHSSDFYRAALFGGEIGMGEAFTDGHWSTPDLPCLIRLAVRNLRLIDSSNSFWSVVSRMAARLSHLRRKNSIQGSQRNIQAHYDLSNDFFRLFLGETMMYSAALWERESDTLEQAQWNKLDRIARVLRLRPEDHLLEIGAGWGTFAVHVAKRYGCRVTSTTISKEQFAMAQEQVAEAGVEDRVTLLLEDYRNLQGTYTKGVSIEMFEAVGLEHYDEYFAAWERLIEPGGEVMIQTITMNEANFPSYQRRPDWIQKYIFPGGELASMIEIQHSLARTGHFQLQHFSDLGLHYAHTLREWRRRFQERLGEVRSLGFDEPFIRMWDYYLGYCEGAFLERYIGVAQLLLVHSTAQSGVHGEPWVAHGKQRAGVQ